MRELLSLFRRLPLLLDAVFELDSETALDSSIMCPPHGGEFLDNIILLF